MRTFVKVIKGDLVKPKDDWFPDNFRVYLPVATRHFKLGDKGFYYVDSLCLDLDGEHLYLPNNLVTDILQSMKMFAKVVVGAVVQVKFEGIYMDINFEGVVTDLLPGFPRGKFLCRACGIHDECIVAGDEYIVAGDMVSDIISE